MPYLDRDQQNAAKIRSRRKQMADGRCTRCGSTNDQPAVNRRRCSRCSATDAAEKKAARQALTAKLKAIEALFTKRK